MRTLAGVVCRFFVASGVGFLVLSATGVELKQFWLTAGLVCV